MIFLLLGIWLAIFPMGQSSKLPEVASIASVVLGILFGVGSLFTSEK
jgi:hypothetical protein